MYLTRKTFHLKLHLIVITIDKELHLQKNDEDGKGAFGSNFKFLWRM